MENIIIGRNSVREALKSGAEIEAVYIKLGESEGSVGQITRLARDARVLVKYVPKQKLDNLCKESGDKGNHQGVAAVIAGVEYADVADIFKKAEGKGEPPFIMLLDGITDPHNLGAIVRSAEVLGAHGVITGTRNCAGMTMAARKSASGAENFIPIVKVTNIAQTLEEIKAKGVFAVCADMDGTPAEKLDLTGAICIVIGDEGQGVSRLVKEKCDFTAKIDVFGQINCLNASCAAAVLMYEKQRQSKG